MTDYDEPPPPPHPAVATTPAPIGAPATPVAAMATQATAIEATRAVAEVQALVAAAKSMPRVRSQAVARMHEACDDFDPDDAFWSFRRAGSQLTGPTVQLLRALALCWGNVTSGSSELSRDEANGMSEMQAWAWDLEANYRVAITFLVPHRRDRSDGRKPLDSDRDVYENNANQAARREREMIRRVLPRWFVTEAEDRVRTRAQGDPSIPLDMRVAKVVAFFGDTYGVRPDQLEAHVGAAPNDWTVYDLAKLSAVKGSLHRGETTVDAEFPRARLTAAEVAAQHTAPPEPIPTVPDGAGLRPVPGGEDPM